MQGTLLSRRVIGRASLALILAVALFAATVAGSFAGKGYVYDQFYEHENSQAWADNNIDYSLLSPDSSGHVDQRLSSCDNSFNGEPAVARGFDNGGVVATISDQPADGHCSTLDFNRNMGGHDECVGRYDSGNVFGCGPNSNHGN